MVSVWGGSGDFIFWKSGISGGFRAGLPACRGAASPLAVSSLESLSESASIQLADVRGPSRGVWDIGDRAMGELVTGVCALGTGEDRPKV